MKTLYLMQGIPGSGKSTRATELAQEVGAAIYSTDFFWGPEYRWNPAKTGTAHRWNQACVEKAMIAGDPAIIVDNTNITVDAVKPYYELAHEYMYRVIMVRVDTPLDVCLERNAQRPEHRRIPEDVIREMHGKLSSWD